MLLSPRIKTKHLSKTKKRKKLDHEEIWCPYYTYKTGISKWSLIPQHNYYFYLFSGTNIEVEEAHVSYGHSGKGRRGRDVNIFGRSGKASWVHMEWRGTRVSVEWSIPVHLCLPYNPLSSRDSNKSNILVSFAISAAKYPPKNQFEGGFIWFMESEGTVHESSDGSRSRKLPQSGKRQSQILVLGWPAFSFLFASWS